MKLVRPAVLAALAHAAAAPVVSAQLDFRKINEGCIGFAEGGLSWPDCPREYRITEGPGYCGQRMNELWHTAWGTRLICSSSCVPGSSTAVDGECSLILVLHSRETTPLDMRLFMMGDEHIESVTEDEADGGPFCISFHMATGISAPDDWEQSCSGDDADHIEGFIRWVLDEFPTIDPDAVNLHGYGSGATQVLNFMDTSCPIESLVAAAATYAGGHVSSPPTTKAALLLAHGTHDAAVPYEEGWDYDTGTAVPVCGIGPAHGPSFRFGFSKSYKELFAETLAAGAAKYRGYGGDVYDPIPAPTGSIDLIDESIRGTGCHLLAYGCPTKPYLVHLIDDDDFYNSVVDCETVLEGCVNQDEEPSAWNEGFSCAALPDEETDIIDYPVSPGAAPVRLLRVNIHNHDYPNRRRTAMGPSEFFLYLRRFFRDNRGSRPPTAHRTVQEVDPGRVCAGPDYLRDVPGTAFRGSAWENIKPDPWGCIEYGRAVTPEICAERCRADEECVESFYMNFTVYGAPEVCHLHYRFLPCTSTEVADFPARHFVTTPQTHSPTPRPTPLCTDTPGWVDEFDDGCAWYEEHDEPGCPLYGHLYEGEAGAANYNCCYCQMTGRSAPCTGNTPGWVDSAGDGCAWYEWNDEPGCPDNGHLYEGEAGVANDNCCYCQMTAPTPTPPSNPTFLNVIGGYTRASTKDSKSPWVLQNDWGNTNGVDSGKVATMRAWSGTYGDGQQEMYLFLEESSLGPGLIRGIRQYASSKDSKLPWIKQHEWGEFDGLVEVNVADYRCWSPDYGDGHCVLKFYLDQEGTKYDGMKGFVMETSTLNGAAERKITRKWGEQSGHKELMAHFRTWDGSFGGESQGYLSVIRE